MRAMMKRILPVVILLSFPLALAQDSGAPPAIYKPGADVLNELDEAARNSSSAAGVSVTISPGISVRRRMSGVANYAVLHPYSVEIYRILEGSGTLVTGGLLKLPLADSTSDDIVRTQNGIEARRRGTKVGLFRAAAEDVRPGGAVPFRD